MSAEEPQYPKFPREFVERHCLKVMEARDWRKTFKLPPDPEDDAAYAECEFRNAGLGMECEACGLHLTRPYLHHKVDEEWLPRIEEYYRKVREIDAAQSKKPPRR